MFGEGVKCGGHSNGAHATRMRMHRARGITKPSLMSMGGLKVVPSTGSLPGATRRGPNKTRKEREGGRAVGGLISDAAPVARNTAEHRAASSRGGCLSCFGNWQEPISDAGLGAGSPFFVFLSAWLPAAIARSSPAWSQVTNSKSACTESQQIFLFLRSALAVGTALSADDSRSTYSYDVRPFR
jgi:hypothetical protein